MSLNDSMSSYERAQLAVWDYPVSDRYTKMWQAMKEAGLPTSFNEAVERVRASPSSSEGYAFLGNVHLLFNFRQSFSILRMKWVNFKGMNSSINWHFEHAGDATDIRYAALTNCDLQMVGEEFSRKPYALAVQQGSPLKDILNDA